MRELPGILETIATLTAPAVLATVVRVKGSSYRKPGARMLFTPDGLRTGLISAGCLETDVMARAEAVLATAEPQLAVYDMGSELDLVWGTGMGCEGKVEVLLERISEAPAWMPSCARMLEDRCTGLLATVFASRGETGMAVGTRFLLDSDETTALLPPAPMKEALTQEGAPLLPRGISAPVTLPSGEGQVDVLLEAITPPYALWIYGAGEHGRPIAQLAKALGWFVGIVDHRPALATPARFPEVDRIVLGPPDVSLKSLPFDDRTAALVVSHVYERDKEALIALRDAPVAYLGLQGNRNRCSRLVHELEAAGGPLTEAERNRLYAPAGLDIGGEGPEAIALSMLSEIQAVLTGFPAGHLRDRAGRIRN